MQHTTPTIEFAATDQPSTTTHAFLLTVLQWSLDHAVWQPVTRLLDLKLKTVTYSPLHKLQTVFASLLLGCQFNKDINTDLTPDQPAAAMLGLDRFPDQSQINIFLRRFDQSNLQQLERIHAEQFEQLTDLTKLPTWRGYLVVDVDQTALLANGKSYELACKGYFPDHAGEQGYQLSAAYLGQERLTLALRLDPGNVHGYKVLPQVAALVEQRLPQAKVLYRLDAGYGAQPQVRWLLTSGRNFAVKARLNKPEKWVAKVASGDWRGVSGRDDVRVGAVNNPGLARAVACVVRMADGSEESYVLLTSLSVAQHSASEVWHLYQGRQSIEAFFKAGRAAYGLGNLRSRKFEAISAFLWLVSISHNLLVWAKQELLAGSALAELGSRELVVRLGRLRVGYERTASGYRLLVGQLERLARKLMEALQSGWIQLELRLYET